MITRDMTRQQPIAGKLLTVSVAVYNVQDYLRQCLDSCCVSEIVDYLDVIVVNDGSTDESAAIAQSYVDRYPNSFRLINKPNGGYGTTVNASMAVAKGKYYKLLDGDDWFDREGLVALVERLQDAEADWIVTPRLISQNGEKPTQNMPAWKGHFGETLSLGEIDFDFYPNHWQLTVKTALIREHPFELPGGMPYTDELFVIASMAYISNCLFLDKGVYCYRVGRPEQSISLEFRSKNLELLERIHEIKVAFYKERRDDLRPDNRKAVVGRIASSYSNKVKTLLLFPHSKETLRLIKRFEGMVKEDGEGLYEAAAYHRPWLKVLRLFGYRGYALFRFIDASNRKYWFQS